MIYKIYEKYETSPVIVSFATKETPIYKIPFPAVTLCPEVKSDKEKFNLDQIFQKRNFTQTEKKYFQDLSLFCDDIEDFKEILLNETLDDFSDNIFERLDEIKPDFMFFDCKFLGEKSAPCEKLFTPIFTDEGVCYTFNILDRSHIFSDRVTHYKNYHKIPNDTQLWNMERGYFDNTKLWIYPWRALYSGANHGLTLHLATRDQDLDFRCKGIQGFKVVLHSPVRLPRLKQEFIRIPLNHAVVVSVQPVMIETSQAVKNFDSEKRLCYFPTERNLKFFRSYSQQNCHLECLTNITLDLCHCVSIFMPRENGTKICGIGKNSCVKRAEQVMHLGEVSEVFQDFQFDDVRCDCLPLCTDLSYNYQMSQIQWDWKETVKTMENQFDKEMLHLSSLRIYFKFNHFITSQRQELYGPTDFIANFGGLLGLFMGFSLLSLAEIVYFLTIRICCNIRMYRNWRGTSEEEE